ncbi:hypothetical protein OHA21_43755 [Actinoplanes sp. NBC_00393]|uniref:hypothetical protein n=1 Tax=Actinoplanes sp. NBC_00393 TaxID=2975953 RepID=UPI002E202923
MTQQPLIPHQTEPRRAWIWTRLKDAHGAVDDTAWTYHRDSKQHVGKCHCGQPLMPGVPYQVGPRNEYPATCSAGHELVAHGPRPAKKKTN